MKSVKRQRAPLIILTMCLLISVAWFGMQYFRTGHLVAYIAPPSFIDIPKGKQDFIIGLKSYQGIEEVRLHLKNEEVVLEETLDEGRFKDRKFVVNVYKINNFKIENRIFPVRLLFYNNRLAQVRLCSERSLEDIIDTIKKTFKYDVNQQTSTHYRNLVLEYAYQEKKHCAFFEDQRLSSEASLWSELTM